MRGFYSQSENRDGVWFLIPATKHDKIVGHTWITNRVGIDVIIKGILSFNPGFNSRIYK